MKTQKETAMKKVLFFMSVALVAMIGFSSCSDDENEASVLSGEWQGDWNMWYMDANGYTWYADMTYIRFDRSHSTSGTGRQVDYYRRGPYEYLTYKFRWTVRDGVIYLTYPYDNNLDTWIYNYHLDNWRFDGYFGSSKAYFTMDKLTSFDYWEPTFWVDSWYGYTVYIYGSKEYENAVGSKSYNGGRLPEIIKRGGHSPKMLEQNNAGN